MAHLQLSSEGAVLEGGEEVVQLFSGFFLKFFVVTQDFQPLSKYSLQVFWRNRYFQFFEI